MNAKILPFPDRRTPSCFICEHAITNADGTYCRIFREEILLESYGQDCPEFEDDPHKQ